MNWVAFYIGSAHAYPQGAAEKCVVLIGAWGVRIPVCGVFFLLGDDEALCLFVWA